MTISLIVLYSRHSCKKENKKKRVQQVNNIEK